MSEWGWIRDNNKRGHMQLFAKEWGLKFNDVNGSSIGGLAVKEFEDLLAFVTNRKHRSFQSLGAIAQDFYAIDSAIVNEMRRPAPRGKNANDKNHDEAAHSLANLRLIVRCLAQYFRLANELGLSAMPKIV